MAYKVDDCLSDAKLRAFYPTSGGVLADSDILRLANDELLGILTARQMSSVQGHLGVEAQFPLVPNVNRYEIPYRAAGSKLRYICVIDAQGNRFNLHPSRPEQLVTTYNLTIQIPSLSPSNCWFEGGRIVVYPMPGSAQFSLLMGYYIRPSRLVLTSATATVTSPAAAGATSFSVSALPSNFNTKTSIDVIRATPPFNVLTYDSPTAALTTGATSITTSALPYALNVGDVVSLPEETSVPQMPAELYPLLSARIAKRILQARGDVPNMQVVVADISELETNVYEYLSNRNEGQVDTMGENNLMPNRTGYFGLFGGGY